MTDFWQDALTLGQWIVKVVKTNQTHTSEFKTLLMIYGKEKVRALYEEALRNEKKGSTHEEKQTRNPRL